MAEKAREYTGLDVKHHQFQDLGFDTEFDGIWACASLLHVGKDQMQSVLDKLKKALKSKGVLYLSFKYGQEEMLRNGRFFNDYTEEQLDGLFKKHADFQFIKKWITSDQRPERSDRWINALLVKEIFAL
jgi:cyclopropane fatty-acyl-phospholipid synthase-like methyltransferase